MHGIRNAIEVEVEKYEPGKGMEDGFELFTEVVTHGWICTDRILRIKREDGKVVCPYITCHRGRLFIEENDYIITNQDGSRYLCGESKVFDRYHL
ncbi:MAG: hypothetical protein II073_06600 [Lachnospiraceae bacterium]|nr:hypothetical protein [Lachnospiraceae bacterium]